MASSTESVPLPGGGAAGRDERTRNLRRPGSIPGAPPGPSPESLCEDQARRWRRGERVEVEAYLREHPSLDPDGTGTFDLIYNEFVLRETLGEFPEVAEF